MTALLLSGKSQKRNAFMVQFLPKKYFTKFGFRINPQKNISMKKLSIIFSLLLAVNFSFAQTTTPAKSQPAKAEVKTGTAVRTTAQVMPSFPGGEEKLAQFLSTNIKYPKEALDNKVEGTVYVSFVVDETGKITNVQMLKRMAYGMDQEAMRVVKMMPNWIPGQQDGKPVAVQFTLPVKFSLGNTQQK
jgi:TonB family protein